MKDQRITNRTEQLNLKVKKRFKEKLKAIATQENSLLTEIVEKAVVLYEQKIKRQLNYQKKQQAQKILVHPEMDFKCDNCYRDFEQTVAYSFISNWKELDKPYTYCSWCVKRRI